MTTQVGREARYIEKTGQTPESLRSFKNMARATCTANGIISMFLALRETHQGHRRKPRASVVYSGIVAEHLAVTTGQHD